ncbi:transglutaminase domain-containing protein [Pyrococcus sp. ST04]|uniref:transglutaminase domain-containing protein n=1 Tax=Pyrococcus sp. ST04 TaxID=1183377 RepID=UPI00026058E6|nr:transglutaminase domain-containing protein [Pyrococcus sp. ST04]AFK22246.1 hypothetical protein Py04_0644 [Pyrococcus sp. ST04]
MRHLKLVVVMLIILSLGCLIKSPAHVRFEVDTHVIPPGGVFHLIVTINNTGKVGIIGANLEIEGDDFIILQSPKFPTVLKVGNVTKLVWTIQGPKVPGTYPFKAYLDIVDELHRVWKGNIYETSIKVTKIQTTRENVEVDLIGPNVTYGGKIFNISMLIENNLSTAIYITGVDVNPGPFQLVNERIPKHVPPSGKVYGEISFRAPSRYLEGSIYVIISYSSVFGNEKIVKEKEITVVWRPWELNDEELKNAYGNITEWIKYDKVVDGYWEWMFGSKSDINFNELRKVIFPLVGNLSSDLEAGKVLYNYIITHYTFENRMIRSLDPQAIQKSTTISPTEADILLVGYFRSLNIPARIVSVYDGFDCTKIPFVEAYISEKWYVIDFRHMFFGTREEYITSPWYPRIYQQIEIFGNKLVALKPSEAGHNHENITNDYLDITEKALLEYLYKKLDSESFLRLKLLLKKLNDKNERIFALFLFSVGDKNEAQDILTNTSIDKLANTIKAFYEFYKDITWEDDFKVYWNKLMEIYRS